MFENYLGSFVRHGLTALGGVLVTVGISEEDAANFSSAAAPIFAGIVSYGIGQLLSLKKVRDLFD